jgi:hypothetical protein
MAYMPEDAPLEVNSYDTVMVLLVMEDDFEQPGAWDVGVQNLSSGAWELGDPEGTAAQPEDDHSPAGTKCFVTGRAGGGPNDNDVDGDLTMLRSPAIDLSVGDADVSFHLWFYHGIHGVQQPLEIQISNTGTAPWTPVQEVTHNPAWQLISFKVADYVSPTADVKVRFLAKDQYEDSFVEALVDDFKVERFDYSPTLWADTYSIPVASGGDVGFTLDAGAANANRPYLLCGSATGISPGVPLPGGAVMPIVYDGLTRALLRLVNTGTCQNFMGQLDASGKASALLHLPGPIDPMVIGVKFYFAYYASIYPYFASSPIIVTFVP